MKRVLTVLVLFVCLTCTSACVFAGNNPSLKVAVHVRDHNQKLVCNLGITISDCDDITTTSSSSSIDAFPIFYDLSEFKGVEYGLTWPDWTYSAAFTSCSDLVIGEILWPSEGAAHAWFSCQEASIAVPSFVWLYADAAGQICVTDNLGAIPDPGIHLLDCAEQYDEPSGNFCAGVYGATGDDPCATVGTEAATWGELKALFE